MEAELGQIGLEIEQDEDVGVYYVVFDFCAAMFANVIYIIYLFSFVHISTGS